MHRKLVPDVFEIPEPMAARPRSWLTAPAMTAIVIGATLVLMVANETPREDPQISVMR